MAGLDQLSLAGGMMMVGGWLRLRLRLAESPAPALFSKRGATIASQREEKMGVR